MEVRAFSSGSQGNSYLLHDGHAPLLIECGLRIQALRVALDHKITDLTWCLVSHEHQDHCRAVRDLMRSGIDCFMSEGTKEALGLNGHRAVILKALEQATVAGWKVLPFETQHDAKEPLGFLLKSMAGEKVLYATDTYYIRYKFQGLNYILVECNYADDLLMANIQSGALDPALRKRIRQSHFSLANVKKFLMANDLSRVREIWLLHLSDGNSDAERFKKEVQQLTGKPVIVAG